VNGYAIADDRSRARLNRRNFTRDVATAAAAVTAAAVAAAAAAAARRPVTLTGLVAAQLFRTRVR